VAADSGPSRISRRKPATDRHPIPNSAHMVAHAPQADPGCCCRSPRRIRSAPRHSPWRAVNNHAQTTAHLAPTGPSSGEQILGTTLKAIHSVATTGLAIRAASQSRCPVAGFTLDMNSLIEASIASSDIVSLELITLAVNP